MKESDMDWPSAPTGIKNAGNFSDYELAELIEELRDAEQNDWFSKVTPCEDPPQVDHLPEIVQEDVLDDHREDLKKAPDEPTEEYRKTALEYFDSVETSRTKVRPDSLNPLEELPSGIERKTKRKWVFYGVTEEMGERNDDRPSSDADITEGGKYLFFTPDETGVLEKIVFEQFNARPFESAKVPTKINRQEDAVLCLYYDNNRYEDDLRAEYQNEDNEYGLASPYDPDEPIIMPRGYKEGK